VPGKPQVASGPPQDLSDNYFITMICLDGDETAAHQCRTTQRNPRWLVDGAPLRNWNAGHVEVS
jgi:hypothetical protein